MFIYPARTTIRPYVRIIYKYTGLLICNLLWSCGTGVLYYVMNLYREMEQVDG